MNTLLTIHAPLFGRILLGAFFLLGGIQKALNFPSFVDFFGGIITYHTVPFSLVFVSFEILLGILLIVDIKARVVSLMLVLYMILSSFIFTQISSVYNLQLFLQNMAIVGGLLMCAAYGTSRWTPAWQR